MTNTDCYIACKGNIIIRHGKGCAICYAIRGNIPEYSQITLHAPLSMQCTWMTILQRTGAFNYSYHLSTDALSVQNDDSRSRYNHTPAILLHFTTSTRGSLMTLILKTSPLFEYFLRTRSKLRLSSNDDIYCRHSIYAVNLIDARNRLLNAWRSTIQFVRYTFALSFLATALFGGDKAKRHLMGSCRQFEPASVPSVNKAHCGRRTSRATDGDFIKTTHPITHLYIRSKMNYTDRRIQVKIE